MIISLRKITQFIYTILWIVMFSLVLYKMLSVVHVMMEPTDPYKEPNGRAVKVITDGNHNVEWWQFVVARLREFYAVGE